MPVSPDTVDTVQNFDIEDLLDASSGGSGGNNTIRINGTAEIVSRRELVHVDMADTYEIPVTDGYIRYGHYEGTGPAYTTQEIQRVVQDPINSNTSIIKRSTIKQPYNTSVDSTTGKMTVSGQPKSGMLSANAAYFINAVNAAQFCTSVGVALGKGFDQYLYDSNPDYWDSIGLSSLNPETWASLTYEDDSLGARMFNAIFGIDSATGNAQMYMNADAFAYIAQCMNNAGIFANAGYDISWPVTTDGRTYTVTKTPSVHMLNVVTNSYAYNGIHGRGTATVTTSFSEPVIGCFFKKTVGGSPLIQYTVSVSNPNATYTIHTSYPDGTSDETTYNFDTFSNTQAQSNGWYPTVYYKQLSGYVDVASSIPNDWLNQDDPTYGNTISGPGMNESNNRAYILYMGGCSSFGEVIPTIPGVDTQQGAVVPNTSDWTDLESIANSLRLQYPELFNNAITYDVPNEQGQLVEQTYVPVAWPTTTANPWTDVQPTTDTAVQTQTQTMVDLLEAIQAQTGTLTKTLADTLTRTITQPVNTSPTGTVPPAENPTNTGSGSSPVPVSTSGSSSKLWSVYHPTQAQVDAFGSWLWSTNFIDQIMKMFQNPMEGIISLHKVFATPIDAGTGNIVVGTLDSGVASATVTQQYVYVSCGSVDCHEDFGNVFDYSPHTHVSLYLPFIGIVPLDVSDVMRSTITIEYGVDMFTGACLAMVKVSRDNDTVNMYQYAGSASVEYPLSNVQQSQLLSGILAVAAGGAAIATGGMSIAAGAAVIGGAANAMKANVGRSGGFSGNAGAMGIKKPYLIIQRPQTKVASLFPRLAGYPTNISGKLSDFSGQVKVTDVHVEGIPATDVELTQIEELLHSGVLV